jgi:hypothetical protein
MDWCVKLAEKLISSCVKLFSHLITRISSGTFYDGSDTEISHKRLVGELEHIDCVRRANGTNKLMLLKVVMVLVV